MIETTKREIYRVYLQIRGVWFNKEFPIKKQLSQSKGNPPNSYEYDAKTLQEVKAIAGKKGKVFKITTIGEPLYIGEE